MPTYGMVIDLDRCTGCYDCQIACKDEHVYNEFAPIATSQPIFGHFWMKVTERELVLNSSHIKVAYIPKPCNQCADPACLKAAKDGAVYQRPDGIVIIDPVKAVGQKQIMEACPYGSIYWNEEKNVPQKCTFCAHLVDDGWQEPRCAQACPMSCIVFGDLDDPNSKISKFVTGKKAEVLNPEFKTKPKVSYVGLPKPYLSGTIRYKDSKECANGVKVTLEGPKGQKAETVSDYFGDFEFKNVASGKHKISYAMDGYKQQSKSFEITGEITDLGEIALAAAK